MPFYTKTTLALMRGEHINSIERDMTDKRRLNPRKKNRNKTSAPPRTRDGQMYPGGKHMRSVLANLARRQNDYNSSKNQETLTKPGSMNNG